MRGIFITLCHSYCFYVQSCMPIYKYTYERKKCFFLHDSFYLRLRSISQNGSLFWCRRCHLHHRFCDINMRSNMKPQSASHHLKSSSLIVRPGFFFHYISFGCVFLLFDFFFRCQYSHIWLVLLSAFDVDDRPCRKAVSWHMCFQNTQFFCAFIQARGYVQ